MRARADALIAAVLLAALAGVSATAVAADRAADPAPAAAAAWQPHELTLTYVGVTTRYSCDGLRSHLIDALRALGARGDLTVMPLGCAHPGGVESLPSARIRLWTLRPVNGAPPDAVPARWATVRLGGAGALEPGDCELAQQIRDEILPLFATRKLQARLDCVPHQVSTGSLGFSVEVLVPSEAPPH